MTFDRTWVLLLLILPAAWVIWEWRGESRRTALLLKAAAIMAILLAHLYAWVRPRLGPGPRTALKVGMIVGFFAGFPSNFGTATWSPIDRIFPLAWMLDLWVGSILATLVAGAIYKE